MFIRTTLVVAASFAMVLLAGCQSNPSTSSNTTVGSVMSTIKKPFSSDSSSADSSAKQSAESSIEKKYLLVPRNPNWSQAQRDKADQCAKQLNTKRYANAKRDGEGSVWLYQMATSREASLQIKKEKLKRQGGGLAVAGILSRLNPYGSVASTAGRQAATKHGIELDLAQKAGYQEIHSCVMRR